MYISLSWLKKYVDIDVPVEELCDRMVRSGFEVEDIQDLSETMKNFFVSSHSQILITVQPLFQI